MNFKLCNPNYRSKFEYPHLSIIRVKLENFEGLITKVIKIAQNNIQNCDAHDKGYFRHFQSRKNCKNSNLQLSLKILKTTEFTTYIQFCLKNEN
jgi:hypothetical protein